MPHDDWPELPLSAWEDTYATLHRCTQVVGKLRLALSPMVNHWWNAALHLSARGLVTPPMPCGERFLSCALDFVDHHLALSLDDGRTELVPLQARPVADFWAQTLAALRSLGLELSLNPAPQEIPGAQSLAEDRAHASYDAEAVERWWRASLQAYRVLDEFRGRFRGKCSPVHFFWGSFDLAVTRFSGRPAPPREGADLITREAYSDEVSSAGFWPGGGPVPFAAFYCYFAPAPEGLETAPVEPATARWSPELKQFLLPYDAVRASPSPRRTLLEFLQSAYEAGADLAGWDREALERHGDEAGRPAIAEPAEPLIEPPTTGGPIVGGP